MMDQAGLVRMTIDLIHVPSQVRLLRSAPLPDGVLTILRIVAGDEEATSHATEATGRSRELVREAAAFFIEQVMFHPEADSYRVLGTRPDASKGELRRNMSLLLRWLHPDTDPQRVRSVFAARVTRAWNDLKSDERRAAYDRSRRMALTEKALAAKKGSNYSKNRIMARRQPTRSPHGMHARHHRPFNMPAKPTGFLRRILLLLLWKVVR